MSTINEKEPVQEIAATPIDPIRVLLIATADPKRVLKQALKHLEEIKKIVVAGGLVNEQMLESFYDSADLHHEIVSRDNLEKAKIEAEKATAAADKLVAETKAKEEAAAAAKPIKKGSADAEK